MATPRSLGEWIATIIFILGAIYIAWHWVIPFLLGALRQALSTILVMVIIAGALYWGVRNWLR
jgi:hypothetical protein